MVSWLPRDTLCKHTLAMSIPQRNVYSTSTTAHLNNKNKSSPDKNSPKIPQHTTPPTHSTMKTLDLTLQCLSPYPCTSTRKNRGSEKGEGEGGREGGREREEGGRQKTTTSLRVRCTLVEGEGEGGSSFTSVADSVCVGVKADGRRTAHRR